MLELIVVVEMILGTINLFNTYPKSVKVFRILLEK